MPQETNLAIRTTTTNSVAKAVKRMIAKQLRRAVKKRMMLFAVFCVTGSSASEKLVSTANLIVWASIWTAVGGGWVAKVGGRPGVVWKRFW